MSSASAVYTYSAVMMGSPILLKLFDHNETLARNVFRLIKQQENLLTVNHTKSEVMTINHAAGLHPVVVSQPVFDLISRARAVSVLPGSSFNCTIGPLVKRWKIGFHGNSTPPAEVNQRVLYLLLTQIVTHYVGNVAFSNRAEIHFHTELLQKH
ncbi:hypothetical protein EWM58_00670 [Candidatus Erwinia dacicola]|nr:hypothetical protein [Candidatus Erwinia dacicola]